MFHLTELRKLPSKDELLKILEAGFWAPNGDNFQPWQILVHADASITIQMMCHSDGAMGVLNHDFGQPVMLSAGALIENIIMAAGMAGYGFEYWSEGERQDNACKILSWRGRFTALSSPVSNPLYACIEKRRVDRRPYRPSQLSQEMRQTLMRAVKTPNVNLMWSSAPRRFWASMQTLASRMRILLPCFEKLNTEVLDFNWANSTTKMPAATLFLEPITRYLLQRTIRTTWAPALLRRFPALSAPMAFQMDYLPVLMSGGYFLLIDQSCRLAQSDLSVQDRQAFLTEVGRDIQRVWLTAHALGLSLQPMYSTLIFPAFAETHREVLDAGPAYLPQWLHRYMERLRKNVYAPLELQDRRQILFVARTGKTVTSPNRRPHSIRRPVSECVSFDDAYQSGL